ncbi:hypothetical protein [Bdellovibrio sp. NC01]|uniref:hypothetical protein n=1 Tax=Bdellovibrio sp. NC01 TaxID=2220073 RepID=UPI00115A3ABD|nr:hypothetical protein [Bdellovibrio sp. NC01]QDK37739.1 hypothetical protein DOE51_09150 [Bdellovibrio sp. NC01]
MSQHAWFEHFKEKLQALTPAFEESGTMMSLLGFAIKEKHLSSEDYLKWAMTHYRLPYLQDRFFKETPLSQEMFAKWATHYPWSAECLPVAEWDGALIVACLQPPQDFPTFPSAVIVLASLENMEAAWKAYHPEVASASATAVAAALPASAETAPEGIDLSVVTTSKKSDSFSFEDLGVAPEAKDDEVILEGEEAGGAKLDGIFDGFTVTKLEALAPKEPGTESVVAEVKQDSVVAATEAKTVVTQAPKSSILEKTNIGEVPKEDTSLPAAAPATSAGKPNIPPPPAKATPAASAAANPPPFEDSFVKEPIAVVPRPAGVAKPTLNPVANGTFALDKLKKKNTAALTERVKTVLSEMKSHFEKSMILTLDDQETQATAFAWDENFKGMKDTSVRVPLKTPSIFNIVAATSKPFHGYVSLNEINEKFFEDWNQGRVPDHVTIAPILINDKLVGMLVGFAEKAAYNRTSLSLAEKLSVDFVKGLQAA